MTNLRLLDLFSGIGGFSYAAERLVGGYETVGFCEIDPFCKQILNKHWPDVEVFEDVRRTDDFVRCGRVDIITGGYPCQPFSLAGKQKGVEDDRHLWPAMFELIKQKRPAFVVGENVAGHITLGLDQVLFDLESEGYTARPFVVPACAVDAPHRRDRVWIVAHANRKGEPDVAGYGEAGERLGPEHVGDTSGGRLSGDDWRRSGQESEDGRAHVADATSGENDQRERRDVDETPRGGESGNAAARFGGQDVAHADSKRGRRRDASRQDATAARKSPGHKRDNAGGMEAWLPEPDVGRVAHGVSRRVDRLKSLGNSIVPQVAAQILRAIREAHDA